MKYALVHDWLVDYSGSERVVERLLEVIPQADLHSLVDFLPSGSRGFIRDKSVKTSFIQNLPFAKSKYRYYFPFMPMAIEQFDMTGYDVVVSSSHAFAKGVITRGEQFHISYVHTPVRYAWELQHEYLRQAGYAKGLKGKLIRMLLHYVRNWDLGTANRVDHFVCNSQYIAKRVWRTYRRQAEVVYPPVDVQKFDLESKKEDFYLAASRFVPYKHMNTIVQAFAKLQNRKLFVIGDGPEFANVAKNAPPNVTLLGFQPFDVLHDYMRKARAYVFAADEDFGIMPVEVQACGTPVIAYGRGGATETVVPGKTGMLFHEQTPEAIAEAVRQFERDEQEFEPEVIRANAERFRPEVFLEKMRSIIELAGDKVRQNRLHQPDEDWGHRFDGDEHVMAESLTRRESLASLQR